VSTASEARKTIAQRYQQQQAARSVLQKEREGLERELLGVEMTAERARGQLHEVHYISLSHFYLTHISAHAFSHNCILFL
jgi:hypothetical protein